MKHKNKQGYGKFYYNRRSIGAHRFIYQHLNGQLDNGIFVCHTCDNPSCVNPKHLFSGTSLDNNRDMIKKGRRWGEQNQNYSDYICKEIKPHKHSNYNQSEIDETKQRLALKGITFGIE